VLAAVHDVTAAAATSERQSAQRDWARREMEQAEQLSAPCCPSSCRTSLGTKPMSPIAWRITSAATTTISSL